MIRVFHFILACVFIVSGASSVPACYATRPDCQLKSKPGCPIFGSQTKAMTKDARSCCHAGMSKQAGKDTPPVPLERLKRLTIDQIDTPPFDTPHFTPTLIALIISQQIADTLICPPAVFNFYFPLHPPPPSLFLQHQSFLI